MSRGPRQPDAELEPDPEGARRAAPRAPPAEASAEPRDAPPRETRSDSHGRGVAAAPFEGQEEP